MEQARSEGGNVLADHLRVVRLLIKLKDS